MRAGAAVPRLLSPRAALLRRVVELRAQREMFTTKLADAESRLAALARPGVRSSAEDQLHLARQALRAATRIAGEAEAAYRDLFGEPVPVVKICADCGVGKPVDEFPRHPTTGNPRSFCQPCYRARCRAGWWRHRDKRLAELKHYQARREPEARRKYHREYYQEHRDRLRPRYTEQARARRALRSQTNGEQDGRTATL